MFKTILFLRNDVTI